MAAAAMPRETWPRLSISTPLPRASLPQACSHAKIPYNVCPCLRARPRALDSQARLTPKPSALCISRLSRHPGRATAT
eukprot:5428075-Prymnesium_polylepis.1